MARPFRFKEFIVEQDKAAMKIGTDSVLLGSWASVNNEIQSVLDIGTGTGILALQMAQRSASETIDAIEIEALAFEQAFQNFENSPWSDRLFCYHTSLEEFSKEIDDTYDLILSNPPFYTSTYKNLESSRAVARHTESLSFGNLLRHTSELLSKNGVAAFIIPYQEESIFIELASESNLFPRKITHVKGNESALIKRTLIELSFKNDLPKIDSLTIEIDRHRYTQEYKKLVGAFYLDLK